MDDDVIHISSNFEAGVNAECELESPIYDAVEHDSFPNNRASDGNASSCSPEYLQASSDDDGAESTASPVPDEAGESGTGPTAVLVPVTTELSEAEEVFKSLQDALQEGGDE